jgi:hypothetical protein
MSKNYSGIIDLINAVVPLTTYPMTLGWGVESDINIFSTDEHKTILWMFPTIIDDEIFINTLRLNRIYNLEFYVYQTDTIDSSNLSRMGIICDCNDMITEFELALNNYINDNNLRIEISKFHMEPKFQKTDHIFTGYYLTFKLMTPDDFDFCP